MVDTLISICSISLSLLSVSHSLYRYLIPFFRSNLYLTLFFFIAPFIFQRGRWRCLSPSYPFPFFYYSLSPPFPLRLRLGLHPSLKTIKQTKLLKNPYRDQAPSTLPCMESCSSTTDQLEHLRWGIFISRPRNFYLYLILF